MHGMPIESPLVQALLATLFTWGVTALGAAMVFFFRGTGRRGMDRMLAFAGGVMIAASFWSLLEPAIELCRQKGDSPWLVPAVGLLTGGLFIVAADRLLEKHMGEGQQPSFRRSTLVATSIAMHNFPEGMVVGVAFASAASSGLTGIWEAVALSLGIGLQNFPEGASVSLPLRREGISTRKSFLIGQASGMVEPLGAMAGVLAVMAVQGILPFLLCFSAGAMIAVAAVELIPEAAKCNKDAACLSMVFGFVVMMVMDIALG